MKSSIRFGSPMFMMSAAALIGSLVFAGATRSGYAGDGFAQLVALPAALMGLLLTWRVRAEFGWLLGWCAAVLLLILLQLVPLPPSAWAHLPFGQAIQAVHKDVGLTDGWRPLSVSPHDTWLSLLAFLPPAALFFSTLHLNDREKTGLLQLLLGLALLSCLLGLWQVAAVTGYTGSTQKPQSLDPTGLFVNRNHFAAFLYVALVFAAAFMIDGWREALSKPRQLGAASQFGPPALSLLIIVMALAMILLARSRAGMVIAIAAMIGAILIAKLPDRRKLRQGALRWIVVAGVAVFVLISQYTFWRIMDRFAEDPLQDGRTTIADTVWTVGWSLMPFGTGLGTFVPVYKAIEEPSAALMGVYVNRAHNELIEIAMEAGIPGLVLLVFALLWIGRRLLNIFSSSSERWHPLGRQLSAAAGVVVVLLLLHSLVDYPLRTGALACVFALGCGILAKPIGFGATSEARLDLETERPSVNLEPTQAATGEFRKFEMSRANVPEKWTSITTATAVAGRPAQVKATGRTLVPVDKAEWKDAEPPPGADRPQVGDTEGWPDVWRKSTKNASAD